MDNLNQEQFNQALRRLPQYEAPDFLWDRIEDQLTNEGPLHQAIATLPVYTAPDAVWSRIAQKLEKPSLIRQLQTWSWSAAAGIAILLTATLGVYQWQHNQEEISYLYSQEAAPISPSIQLEGDSAADAEVEEVLNLYSHFCKYQAQHEGDCNLDQELEELNQAKAELEAVMERYGEDPDLIRQLSDLELDRTRVVKAMVDKIQTS